MPALSLKVRLLFNAGLNTEPQYFFGTEHNISVAQSIENHQEPKAGINL